jgi:hemerythrin-like domain-containing protein
MTMDDAAAAGDTPSSASRGNAHNASRASALGRELIEVHDWLRQVLLRLREELGSPATVPALPPRSLRAHCLAFCTVLTRHHGSEDRAAFPALAAHDPELAPVLAELERDHRVVAGLLRQVEQVAGDFDQDTAQRVRSELGGLAAVLESHFRWEERRIVDALNSLGSPGRAEDFLGLAPPG